MLRPRSIRGVRPYAPEDVHWRLAEYYGPVHWERRLDPIAELVGTILSQHTSDLNSGRAFKAMVERFGAWEAVLQADVGELTDVIRHGGLAVQKAPRIQAVLREVLERRSELNIDFLKELPIVEAKAWLKSLPGVGPKTAAVVLSFALGVPAFPVDTHIFRVAGRLGLIGPKVSADEAHDVLEEAIAPELVYPMHVYLITHGRQVCKAQRPRCTSCPLSERCPSMGLYASAVKPSATRAKIGRTMHGGAFAR